MSDNHERTYAAPSWRLPPTPGPFASLTQWREWRDQLRALGSGVPGVDASLKIANSTIASMTRGLGLQWSERHGMYGDILDVLTAHLPPQVQTAAIFEPETASGDLNLLLIADKGLSGLRAQALLAPASRELGLKVNVHLCSSEEWAERREKGDAYVSHILSNLVVMIRGEVPQ